VRIHLFGRFAIECDGLPVVSAEVSKAQALFCYLILNRARPQSREALAERFWSELPPPQSRKHLRQALWHLNQVFSGPSMCQDNHLLHVSTEWVEIDPEADLWIDVAAFERAMSSVQGIPGGQLDGRQMHTLRDATTLYQGELLEGCYEDWCLFEKERLHNLYLSGLDKLMDYCEVHEAYEAALDYGTLILRHERARESTHRRMMRLYYRSGDRTAALRQYQRCVETLKNELGVEPGPSTVALFEQIREDRLPGRETSTPTIECLRRMQAALAAMQVEVQQQIRSLERQILQ
jgi:DNA-binding SARP family transcriptional activator